MESVAVQGWALFLIFSGMGLGVFGLLAGVALLILAMARARYPTRYVEHHHHHHDCDCRPDEPEGGAGTHPEDGFDYEDDGEKQVH